MNLAPSKYNDLSPTDRAYFQKLDAAFERKTPAACAECEKQRRINTNLWLTLEETGKPFNERHERTKQSLRNHKRFVGVLMVIITVLLWWR